MLISNLRDLAVALQPILQNQLVVRYGVRRLRMGGIVQYAAEVAIIVAVNDKVLLARTEVFIEIDKRIEVNTKSKLTDLVNNPGAVYRLCKGWEYRRFDDWFHDKPFMGAYEVWRDDRPYTSIKLEASDACWRLLTGVVLNELRVPSTLAADPDACSVFQQMQRRFSAFAAQSDTKWASRKLIAA